jgi:hypothetical protein
LAQSVQADSTDDIDGKPAALPTPIFYRQQMLDVGDLLTTPMQHVPTTFQFATPSSLAFTTETVAAVAEETPLISNTGNLAPSNNDELSLNAGHSWEDMFATATLAQTEYPQQNTEPQPQNVPLFTREYLDGLTIPLLKEILQQMKLRKSGNKTEFG